MNPLGRLSVMQARREGISDRAAQKGEPVINVSGGNGLKHNGVVSTGMGHVTSREIVSDSAPNAYMMADTWRKPTANSQ